MVDQNEEYSHDFSLSLSLSQEGEREMAKHLDNTPFPTRKAMKTEVASEQVQLMFIKHTAHTPWNCIPRVTCSAQCNCMSKRCKRQWKNTNYSKCTRERKRKFNRSFISEERSFYSLLIFLIQTFWFYSPREACIHIISKSHTSCLWMLFCAFRVTLFLDFKGA